MDLLHEASGTHLHGGAGEAVDDDAVAIHGSRTCGRKQHL
jgi:hypothetical protein